LKAKKKSHQLIFQICSNSKILNLNKVTYKSSRHVAYDIIFEFFSKKIQLKSISSKIISKYDFKNNDKAFINEITVGSIRYYHYILYHINAFVKNKKIDKKSLTILLMGIYQLKFMDSVPDYAAISTSVDLAKDKTKNKYKFVNAILRKVSTKDINVDIPEYVSLSFPKWFYDLTLDQFNKNKTINILNFFNKKPINWIRINAENRVVLDKLGDNDIKYHVFEDNNNYIKIKSISNLLIHELIKSGNLYIQSPGSSFVVDLLSPVSGESILDACAAPGGKLTDILIRTSNSSKISAFESDLNRYKLTINNLKNIKADVNILKNIDFLKYNNIKFDKILLDVPCSSSGTISKNPDIKIRKTLKNFTYLRQVQKSLLEKASTILNKGGCIVYSTCSIFDCENWDIINSFLSKNKEFKIINAKKYVGLSYVDRHGALNILPHKHKLDGMFAVRLEFK